jgi:hypothetical protein
VSGESVAETYRLRHVEPVRRGHRASQGCTLREPDGELGKWSSCSTT